MGGLHQIQHGGGFVVIGDPAGTTYVKLTLFLGFQVSFPLLVDQAHLHAQLLPHGGHGHSHFLVVVVGVVEQLELQRLAGIETGLLQQLFCLGIALGLGHLRPFRSNRLEAIDEVRHQGVTRRLALTHHLVGDHITIDGVGERSTDTHIVKRLLLDVVLVVVSTNITGHFQLVRLLFLHLLEALDGHLIGDVHFARQIAAQVSVGRLDGQIDHLVDDGLAIVPVVLVALNFDALVHHPVLQGIGTVGYHIFRLGPLVTELLDHFLRYRIGGGVGEHADEVRDRFLELHFEGVVVGRLHAQRISRLFTCDDLGGIGNGRDLQIPGVRRGGFRINGTLESKNEIVGSDRGTVGPLGIFAHMEDVVLVILGFPRFSHSRENFPFRAGCNETFEQVAQDIGFDRSFGLLRVKGRGLGAVAFYQLLNISQLGSRRDIGSLCHIDATKQCSHQQCVNNCFFMSHFHTPTRTFHAFI